MRDNPSATPWRYAEGRDGGWVVFAGHRSDLREVARFRRRADAEFCCRAANGHGPLAAACGTLHHDGWLAALPPHVADMVRSAIPEE